MTYSIIARDPRDGSLGVAIQSHMFATPRLASTGRAGAGVAAIQSIPDLGYGPRALDRMAEGAEPGAVIEELLAGDPAEPVRQLALLDADGRSAGYTGSGCYPVAEQAASEGVRAQGNMLSAAGTPEAMVAAFDATPGDLESRLLAALEAAEANGGDSRGQQSAGILIVSGDQNAPPGLDVLLEHRVDDSERPLEELRRLLEVGRGYSRLGLLLAPGVAGGPAADNVLLAEAANEFAAAAAALPDRAEPLMWQAIVLARAGQGAEARGAMARALGLNPALEEFLMRIEAAGIVPAGSWAEDG